MRKELELDMETVEKLYSQIKELIEKFTEYYRKNGNEESVECTKLKNKLHEITGKDVSQYNLLEHGEEGLEVLCFRISLPEPNAVNGITKEELTEIVKRIKESVFEMNIGNNFKELFSYYLKNYYHKLLKINFKKYEYQFFNRQRLKNREYFEYKVEEIVEKIWEN